MTKPITTCSCGRKTTRNEYIKYVLFKCVGCGKEYKVFGRVGK